MGMVQTEQAIALVEATTEAITKTQEPKNYVALIIIPVISGMILALFTYWLKRRK